MTKKQLGQHWLSDETSLQRMVQVATVLPGDTVLEIGPGLGNLTDKLLAAKAQIIALEFDQDLIPGLKTKYSSFQGQTSEKQKSGVASDNTKQDFQGQTLEIVEGDIRTYDFTGLPAGYKICANIPYYLTANLLRRLTDEENKPSVTALLVQKEVALKVAAPTDKRSMLATLVQAWYDCSADLVVPAKLFEPAPRVDSQILVLKQKTAPVATLGNWESYVRMIKISFSSPRKKIRANLSSGLQITKVQADELLQLAKISVDARAEALTNGEWQQLLKILP